MSPPSRGPLRPRPCSRLPRTNQFTQQPVAQRAQRRSIISGVCANTVIRGEPFATPRTVFTSNDREAPNPAITLGWFGRLPATGRYVQVSVQPGHRLWCRPRGTTIGVPLTGSGTTRRGGRRPPRPPSSTMSPGGPSATIAPAFMAMMWSAYRHARLRSWRTTTIVLPPSVEVGEQVEQLHLVADVEERRRLVEQQQVGVLGQHHRDPDALALATRQLGRSADRQVGGVRSPRGRTRRPRRPPRSTGGTSPGAGSDPGRRGRRP